MIPLLDPSLFMSGVGPGLYGAGIGLELYKNWSNTVYENNKIKQYEESYKMRRVEEQYMLSQARQNNTLSRNYTALENDRQLSATRGNLALRGVDPNSGTGLAITENTRAMLDTKKFMADQPVFGGSNRMEFPSATKSSFFPALDITSRGLVGLLGTLSKT